MDTPGSAWSIICLSLVCLVSSALCGEEKASPKSPSIFIIAEPNLVKGFPVIVKVKARGPQPIPLLDYYKDVANINVFLVSRTTEDKYTIRSYEIADDDWGAPGEGFVSDGSHQFRVYLQENEERTMLFDLATLRPGIREGTILYDVPPGKYDLSIQFRLSGVKSNSIPVEILGPSHDEEQFLERTGKLVANDFLRTGSGVSWGRFLQVGLEIGTDDWNKFSGVAQRQLQFHALLSKVLAPESPVKDIKRAPLRSMPVPEYLEPEKEFLFIEMEKASGRDVADKASALLQKDRGLRWRVEQVNSQGINLLGPRQYLEWRRKAGDDGPESVNEPSIFIIAEPNVVKGFPVIVKVKARGLQVVPKLDFFGETANIKVFLASKTAKDEYTIRSSRGRDMDLLGPGGGFVSDGVHLYQAVLQENEKRTMLFDLFSFRPGIGKGTILDDVPPGKYKLSIEFPFSGVASNSIAVEIINPSNDEKQFLEKTGRLVANNYFKNGSGVYWGRFLRLGMEISIDDWNKLGKVAQRQLQFHMLLSKVLAPESPVRDIKMEPLKPMPVPEYLKPEKEFLFIEMEKASGKDIAEKASALLQKDPGLRWRFERSRGFLWPRGASEVRRRVRDSITK